MWMSPCLVHFRHGKTVAERKVLLKWKAVSCAVTEVVMPISDDQSSNVHQYSFHRFVMSSGSLDVAMVNGSFRCLQVSSMGRAHLWCLLWPDCLLPQRHKPLWKMHCSHRAADRSRLFSGSQTRVSSFCLAICKQHGDLRVQGIPQVSSQSSR